MPDPLEPFDPSRLMLEHTSATTVHKARAGFRRMLTPDALFIAGPVDLAWLSQARKLGVTALWVGLILWFLRGLKRSDNFLVSNMTMRKWNVEPDAKTRALRKLEKAQLITVERRGKKSPAVTILPVQMKSTPAIEG